MTLALPRLSTILIALAALSLGYIAARPQLRVAAQSRSSSSGNHTDDPLAFQFSEMDRQTAFTIYNASEHNLYVYEGLISSGSKLNCTFVLHLSRLGGPIERQNCSPGTPF